MDTDHHTHDVDPLARVELSVGMLGARLQEVPIMRPCRDCRRRDFLTGLLCRTGSSLPAKVVLSSLLLCSAVPGVSTASAAGQCVGSPAYYHIGYNSGTNPQTNQFEGAAANLTYQLVYLCTGDNTASNFSTVWTAIASNDQTGYAQSGELGDAANCTRHF